MRTSLHRQLKSKAAESGTTVQVLVLEALKAMGYDVVDDDLRDKRKPMMLEAAL